MTALRARQWREFVAPAAVFAVTAAYIVRYYFPAPVYDGWVLINFLRLADAGLLDFEALARPSEGHWHWSAYLVMIPLARTTGASPLAENVFSLTVALAGFAAICAIYARAAKDFSAPGARAWLFGAGALIWFSLDQAANWLWGWQMAVFINTAGVAGVVALLTGDRLGWTQVALAASCALAAVAAFGTGWAILPIGAGLIAARWADAKPAERRAVIAMTGVWLVFSALLAAWFLRLKSFSSLAAGDEMSQPLLGEGGFWFLLQYTVNFIAGPMMRFADHLQLPVLVAGAGLVVWALPPGRRSLDALLRNRSLRAFLALSAYGVGAGVLAGLGRASAFGAEQAFTSRYMSFGNFFWLGVAGVVVIGLERARREGRLARRPLALAGLLVLFKIATIVNVATSQAEIATAHRRAVETLVAAQPAVDEAALAQIVAPHQEVSREILFLQERRWSFYARSARQER